MFIKITNGKPETYTIGNLRRDNPGVSFPKDIPADTLASYGVYPLTRTPLPFYNELEQAAFLLEPYQVDGAWFQDWELRPLPVETLMKNLKLARATAFAEEADPLFFKAQRGEAEMEEWVSKVSEIRSRYPYPQVQPQDASGE